ncbi:RYamide receptor isoform X1 [Musca domestica]|uniref:Neuropeptide Y receptor-like isoform X1 n=3 Tax=Musca TaxID=7369 RepID=A0A9J7CNZ5_MUSDO|nr:RYamide receptor isoform X1 [Musca domestica]XP_058982914.1 RYamide receptor isoform X1 [Musca domestica]
MEYFLREYMARSILPHLNVATVKRRYRSTSGGDGDGGGAGQHKTNITTTTTTTNLSITNAIQQSDREGSIVDGGDSNLYFIEPQQQLLLEAFDSDMGMDVRTQSDIDYGEYSSSDNTTATSTSTYHLLESLASVTTTTISSISHQVTQHTNESFRLLRGDHNVSTSMYAAANCEGECHPDMELNETWSLDACGDDGGDGDTLSSVYFITAVYLLYIPIFVFALLGNGTVCYIVQSTPRMRTVTNYFIANLAMGDILMSLFCVPSSFISTFILGYWPFGIALCHFVNYSQAVSVLVSAYTLVAISIDRYIAIMWPLRPRITKRYAKFIIVGIWFIALATALPIPIVSKLVQPGDWYELCGRYICKEEWPTAEQNYYYTLALLTLQFIVPLSVLIFTYTRIALAVWGKRPPGEAENSRDQRMARSKRKMIKMMVTVVIVFTMCWLPFNILSLLLNDEEVRSWGALPYAWFAVHWLAMSHSCYNPIIYCYMNARFRGGFLQIIYRVPGLRRCCCLRRYLHTRGDRSYETTGTDDAFHLQRVNTCTTFISTRRKLRTNSMQTSQSSCAETTVLR